MAKATAELTGKIKNEEKVNFVARERTSKYIALLDQLLTMEPGQVLELSPAGMQDRDEEDLTVDKLRMHIAAAQRNSPSFNEEKNPAYRFTTRTTEDDTVAVHCTEIKAKTNSEGKMAALKKKASKKQGKK